MYPAPKIFATARSIKAYEKFMKEIGLVDIVMAAIKGKEAKGSKQLETTIRKGEN